MQRLRLQLSPSFDRGSCIISEVMAGRDHYVWSYSLVMAAKFENSDLIGVIGVIGEQFWHCGMSLYTAS